MIFVSRAFFPPPVLDQRVAQSHSAPGRPSHLSGREALDHSIQRPRQRRAREAPPVLRAPPGAVRAGHAPGRPPRQSRHRGTKKHPSARQKGQASSIKVRQRSKDPVTLPPPLPPPPPPLLRTHDHPCLFDIARATTNEKIMLSLYNMRSLRIFKPIQSRVYRYYPVGSRLAPSFSRTHRETERESSSVR